MSCYLNIEKVPMLDLSDEPEKPMSSRKMSMSVSKVEQERRDLDNLISLINRKAREGTITAADLSRRPDIVNIQDFDGMTPLHYAVRYGHLNTVNLLLSRGALAETKNADGDTPLHMAAKYKQEPWTDVSYDEYGRKVQEETNNVKSDIIKALVKAGGKINSTDDTFEIRPVDASIRNPCEYLMI